MSRLRPGRGPRVVSGYQKIPKSGDRFWSKNHEKKYFFKFVQNHSQTVSNHSGDRLVVSKPLYGKLHFLRHLRLRMTSIALPAQSLTKLDLLVDFENFDKKS